jgi:hypothetical protein
MENADHGTQAPEGVSGTSESNPGRPLIEFDLTQLENLGAISAVQSEVAAWYRVSLSTIEKRMADEETLYTHQGAQCTFRQVYEMGIGRGKMSLRRAQMDLALGGNATMQIWLGKQLLAQRDNLELTGANSGPIQHSDTSARQALLDRVHLLAPDPNPQAGTRRSDGGSST